MEEKPMLEDDDETSNVSPEEQEMYDLITTQARGVIYSEHGFKAVTDRFGKAGEEIASAIGQTAAMVMRSVKGGIEKQGRTVPSDILFNAGMEVVSDLVEIALAGKFMDKAQEKEVTEQAVFEGLKAFGDGEIQSGTVTPDKQAAAAQELKEAGVRPSGIVENAQEAA